MVYERLRERLASSHLGTWTQRFMRIENAPGGPYAYLLMKIALAQFNPTIGDFEGNSARILELASAGKVRRRGSGCILRNFACAAILRRISSNVPHSFERNQTELAALAAQDRRCPPSSAMSGKAQDNTGKPVTNSAALIGHGKILFEQRKMLLPTYDVFDEARYFQPAVTQFVFPLGAEKLGITICEDFWNDKSFWPRAAL